MKKEKKEKISICIPTFNRARLLRLTLQSVARQTIKPDEVLIIDNASTDQTEKMAQSFVKKYGFTYIRNEKNLGMAENYNRCFQLAANEHFTFLPSDDLIAPHWYESWTKLIAGKKADLYTSPLSIMDENYRLIWTFPIFKKSCFIPQTRVIPAFTRRFTPGLPPTAASLFRKSVFQKHHIRFRPQEGSECDVRPAVHLFETCSVYYYHCFLFVFRQHDLRSFDRQKKSRSDQFTAKMDNYFSILADIRRRSSSKQISRRSFLHSHLFMTLCNVNLYLVRGQFTQVKKIYQSCLSHFPSLFRRPADWPPFLRTQLEFIKRALTMGRIPKSTAKQLTWLKKYSAQQSFSNK